MLNSSLCGRLFITASSGTSPAVIDAAPDRHIALVVVGRAPGAHVRHARELVEAVAVAGLVAVARRYGGSPSGAVRVGDLAVAHHLHDRHVVAAERHARRAGREVAVVHRCAVVAAARVVTVEDVLRDDAAGLRVAGQDDVADVVPLERAGAVGDAPRRPGRGSASTARSASHRLHPRLHCRGRAQGHHRGVVRRRGVGPDLERRVPLGSNGFTCALSALFCEPAAANSCPARMMIRRHVLPHRRRTHGVHRLDHHRPAEAVGVAWPAHVHRRDEGMTLDFAGGEPLVLDVVEVGGIAVERPLGTNGVEPWRASGRTSVAGVTVIAWPPSSRNCRDTRAARDGRRRPIDASALSLRAARRS